MWLKRSQVWLDISTYCNAACPQCHRTNSQGLGKVDWLPLEQWSLETFKKAFPFPSMHSGFFICGTWGDPMMNKDILPIVKFIVDNSEADIVIDTNGSIRDEEFWWKFGVVGGKQLKVVFAVDGIDQQMHSKYRRNTDLDKVLSNMLELASTEATVDAATIVFKHNEEYLSQISDLVRDNGATVHRLVYTDRFYSTKPFNKLMFEFTDEDGNYDKLEPASVLSKPGQRVVEHIIL